jgi:hypothetical protein
MSAGTVSANEPVLYKLCDIKSGMVSAWQEAFKDDEPVEVKYQHIFVVYVVGVSISYDWPVIMKPLDSGVKRTLVKLAPPLTWDL